MYCTQKWLWFVTASQACHRGSQRRHTWEVCQSWHISDSELPDQPFIYLVRYDKQIRVSLHQYNCFASKSREMREVDNFACLLNKCQRWSTWLNICQNGAGVGHPKKLAATLARKGRSNNEQQGRDCTHLEMTFLLRPLVVSFMQLTALLGWVSMLHLCVQFVHCTEMSSSERVF